GGAAGRGSGRRIGCRRRPAWTRAAPSPAVTTWSVSARASRRAAAAGCAASRSAPPTCPTPAARGCARRLPAPAPRRSEPRPRVTPMLGGGGGALARRAGSVAEDRRGRGRAEDREHLGDQPRPAGLVAGADAGAVVAVEVLGEEQVIAPVGIGLELVRVTEHGPAAVRSAQEEAGEAPGDLPRHLEERERPARAGRAFHGEGVAVV